MARKKGNPLEGIVLVAAAIGALFLWIMDHFGKVLLFVMLIVGVFWGLIYFYKKHKQKLNKKEHPVIYVKQSKTQSQIKAADHKSQVKSVKLERIVVYDVEQRTDRYALQMIAYPIGHPNALPTAYDLFEFSEDKSGKRTETLRNLQILRDSLDIVRRTSNQETAESRLKLAYDEYENLGNYAYLFTTQGFLNLNDYIKDLFVEVHQVMYLNIADRYLEKMHSVKTEKSKQKYRDLALQVLKAGLVDEFADHTLINQKIMTIDKHVPVKIEDSKVNLFEDVTSIFDPAQKVATLHRNATRYKDQKNWAMAVECLQQAWDISLENFSEWFDVQRNLRLPLFLQQAGRFNDAIVKFEFLQAVVLQRIQDAEECGSFLSIKTTGEYDLYVIFDKMRVAAKREKNNDLIEKYQKLSQYHREQFEYFAKLNQEENLKKSKTLNTQQNWQPMPSGDIPHWKNKN